MVRHLPAVALALMIGGATLGAAQASIGAGVILVNLGGADFTGVDDGFGLEGRVMLPVGRALHVGVGAQYSSHGTAINESLKALGIFGEGRYRFATGGTATPYLAARGGWMRGSLSSSAFGGDQTNTGFAFGGGGGVAVALSPGIALDLGAVLHTVSFGDATVDGQTIANTSGSGTAMQIRAGVSFSLGGRR